MDLNTGTDHKVKISATLGTESVSEAWFLVLGDIWGLSSRFEEFLPLFWVIHYGERRASTQTCSNIAWSRGTGLDIQYLSTHCDGHPNWSRRELYFYEMVYLPAVISSRAIWNCLPGWKLAKRTQAVPEWFAVWNIRWLTRETKLNLPFIQV